MIPLWKLRREWGRLRQQLRAIPERFTEPARRRNHEKAFERGFSCRDGQQRQKEKIALVLIFQPSGIAESTLATLCYLASRGYAPFVVSNAPLTDTDQARLAPHIWRVMERPNFGYDFGGYRDGIRQLMRWKISPERFLVLNDSIWFPVLENETLLTKLEAICDGIGGTILRQRGQIRFLESYCYSIPQSSFEAPAFRAYWEKLAITSNKYKVIRRGERGFSEAMADAGLSLHPAYPYDTFLASLAEQDDAFLHKTLLYAAHNYEQNETERQLLLSDTDAPGWRERVLTHIHGTIPREQPYSAYPFAMVRLFGYPILKKSNDRVAQLWRAAYLRAVDAGDLPTPPAPLLTELRCKVQTDMP